MIRINKKSGIFAGIIALLISFTLPTQAGDIDDGKKVFKKCQSCHTIEEGGKRKIGPNLFDIVDANVAANEEYTGKYSNALSEYGGIWTIDRLDVFLTKPKKEVKGTKMGFAGLKKEKDRKNLIAFLKSHSSDGNNESIKGEVSSKVEQTDVELGVLVNDSGAEETFIYCTACHSERIVAQQGLTKDGWIEVLEWMVDEQDMSEIDEPDFTIVIDYLAKNYNVDRANFPK